MVRSPCCSDVNLKKGPWTPEEDEKLIECVNRNGHSNWKQVPKLAGLNRCGKSCRLRWTNYLRPDIKRGRFTEEEERVIINLHSVIGNKWSRIAAHLPGRTDNEIKNFWNTHIRRKLLQMGIDPNTHKPRTDFNYLLNLSQLLAATRSSPWNNLLMLQADATKLAKLQLLQNLLQIMNTSTLQNLENSSLLGSLNIDPAEGLLNGTIAGNLYSEEPTPEVVGFLNRSEAPQLCSDLQAAENSWTCYAGGLDTGSLNTKNSSLSSSYECNIQAESNPPKLVSASASPEASIVNETESNANPSNYSTSSPASTIFEAWDKILEDEASGSCWKDILDLIASS